MFLITGFLRGRNGAYVLPCTFYKYSTPRANSTYFKHQIKSGLIIKFPENNGIKIIQFQISF